MRRRDFVLGMCAGGLATFSAPLVSFARVPGRGRLVFVLLRGRCILFLGQGGDAGVRRVAGLEVRDQPRYPWRGYMLDEARHFQGISTVKKLLDHFADFVRVRAGVEDPLLCSTQFCRRDHFHGAGNLLRVLDRGDPVPDISKARHRLR